MDLNQLLLKGKIMLKNTCCVLILLLLGNYISAENLVRNNDFSQKNSVNMPLHWDYRGKSLDGYVTRENYLQLGNKLDESVMLIQRSIALEPGVEYILSYKVRSVQKDKDAICRIYCEWKKRENGTMRSNSSGAGRLTVANEWRSVSKSFKYEKDFPPPYIVVNVLSQCEVEFKDISIQKFVPKVRKESEIILNGDFEFKDGKSIPYGWSSYRMGKNSITRGKDGGVCILTPKRPGSCWLQGNLLMKAGKVYKFSYEVKSPVAGTQYTIKFVAKNPTVQKICNCDSAKAGTEWEKKSFVINYPEEIISNSLSLTSSQESTICFRNIQIELIDEKVVKQQFGGDWFVYGNSKFAKQGEDEVLEACNNSGGFSASLKDIPLEAGQEYTLSYSVIGVGESGTSTGYHPFRLEAMLSNWKSIAKSPGDDVWNGSYQNKVFNFKIPKNAASQKITINIVTSGNKILFKNIKLKKAEVNPLEEYAITLQKPYYRNMIYSSMQISEIIGKVKTGLSVKRVIINLKQNDKSIFSKDLANNSDTISFSIPAENMVDGKYKLEAVLFGTKGKIATSFIEISKVPKAPMEVIQREDRNFYINGKVFFPIALWQIVSLKNDDDASNLYYAARQGVNLYIQGCANETTALSSLDRAQKYGIKVFLSLGYPRDTKGDQLKIWKIRMANILTEKVKNHPALFGYFLIDEPAWAGKSLNNLTKAYEGFKDLDPYHPVWINAAPRGSIEVHKQYSKAADIYGLDIYPVPYPGGHSGMEDKGLTCVGKYAQMYYDAVGQNKAIWMALQGFSWKQLSVENPVDNGYPTYTESRFMAYDALLNKANSVGYWGAQYILNPEFYDVLFNVTKELQEMSGFFVNAKLVKMLKLKGTHIKYYEYVVNGKKYIIAINLYNEIEKFTINSDFTANELIVFQENRKLTLTNGVINDTLEPFGVHVYGTDKLPAPVNDLPRSIPRLENKVNPFSQFIQEKLYDQQHTVIYDGKTNWIWADAKTYDGCQAWLCKDFTIDKKIKSAKLLVTSDDSCVVYLNGKLLGEDLSWTNLTQFDCSKLLKEGKNVLSAAVSDGGHIPCGFLVELKIETIDGQKYSIISDKTWKASDKADPNWLTNNAWEKWKPAQILAPYGQGRWGKRVKIIQR